MPKNERNGQRQKREERSQRKPELGYYYIVTDTEETEKNYMEGLRDSIPAALQGKIVIKVVEKPTKELVDEAERLFALNPQYSEPWILFDRDEVKDFDAIIALAKSKKIHVGWTNPCIEEWFWAYFGSMPNKQDSVSCCKGFADEYERKTGKKYVKSDPYIYNNLIQFGDEQAAIALAQQKYDEQLRIGRKKPSEMVPCTTVHKLIKEIKEKIQNSDT